MSDVDEFLARISRQADRIEAMDRRELELFLSRADGAGVDLDEILARHDKIMARRAAMPS